MKKKSILVLVLVILIVFLIYLKTRDKDVYYLNFGDEITQIGYATDLKKFFEEKEKLEKFVEFYYEDARITDLMNSIRNNDYIYIENHKKTIQNALIKADLITISVGKNDLEYGLLKKDEIEIYNYMDTLLLDLENFFTEVRKYSKEQIHYLGYFDENSKYLTYFYEKVEKLCKKYEIELILFADNMEKITAIKNQVIAKFTFP